MSSQSAATAPFAQAHRILMGALLAAPLLIGLVLAFVGATDPDTGEGWTTNAPDPLWAGTLLVVGAVLFALLPTVGYKMEPLEPGTEPSEAHRIAQGRYQAAAITRFALAEAPMIMGVMLAFVAISYPLFLLGAVIAVLLMLLHVWPSRRVVEKSAEVLEARGVDSGLRDVFGFGDRL